METRTVYLEPGKITINTVELPELQPHQIFVKTHQASVCGSERYFYRGITVRPKDEARGEPEPHLSETKRDRGHSYAYFMGRWVMKAAAPSSKSAVQSTNTSVAAACKSVTSSAA